MSGWIKLGIVGVLGAGLLGLMLVSAHASRRRALMTHCRNNLRQLGMIGAKELYAGEGVNSENIGRAFWHEVRILSYRKFRSLGPSSVSAKDCRETPCRDPKHWHEWKPFEPDPFVCPVRGTTRTNPDDPSSIDYRGPRLLVKPRPSRLAIGADRGDNHPGGGGFVLFADQSVKERESDVEYAVPESGLWMQAGSVLKD